MVQFVLHNYFRSSTSFRLRIALNLKGVAYDYRAYHLQKGEHRNPAYMTLNTQGLVPALELPDGTILTQSLAIIEYLDAVHPTPRLIPTDPLEAARERALAYRIACDIHPINNLRILNYLRDPLEQDDNAVATWFRHWVKVEFDAFETDLAARSQQTAFCRGETPGLADLCLIPQVANGARFKVDMTRWPLIQRIYDHAMTLDAFAAAAPAVQPDAF